MLSLALSMQGSGKPYRRMCERSSLVKARNISHASQLHDFWKLQIHVFLGHPGVTHAAYGLEDSGSSNRDGVREDVQQPVHHLAAGLLESGSFDEVGDVDEQLQAQSKGIHAKHVLQHSSSVLLERAVLVSAILENNKNL